MSIIILTIIILLFFLESNSVLIIFLSISLFVDFYLFKKNGNHGLNDLSQVLMIFLLSEFLLGEESNILIVFSLILSNVLKVSEIILSKGDNKKVGEKLMVAAVLIFLITGILSYLVSIINSSFPATLMIILAMSFLLSGYNVLVKCKYKYMIFAPFSLLLLHMLFFSGSEIILYRFVAGVGFALLVALISIRLKFLTISGSVATFVMAGMLFGFGGIKWSVPILTFFILSSLLSKVRKKHNEEVELYFEKSGVRDHWQVLANGGLGVVCLVLFFYTSNELFYLMNIASLAAVCADTWATEIGTYKKTNTYNILTLKRIEQGRSGGISLTGTLGSLLGASVISLSGIFWIEIGFAKYFFVIILLGVFGSFVDSFIGATIQHQLQCEVCRKITEKKLHCGEDTTYYSGFTFINNDMVNFVSAAVAVIILFFVSFPV